MLKPLKVVCLLEKKKRFPQMNLSHNAKAPKVVCLCLVTVLFLEKDIPTTRPKVIRSDPGAT